VVFQLNTGREKLLFFEKTIANLTKNASLPDKKCQARLKKWMKSGQFVPFSKLARGLLKDFVGANDT